MSAKNTTKKAVKPVATPRSDAPPFRKILIANRGEIACRVIRTCKRMGIATVAIYSDADADALHVREADEAVRIGPPPSAESYLKIDAVIDACRKTGAEAVHPGYGFLSENAAFATALDKAGIVFIGPPMKAVAAMGDKIESKKLAQRAGVNMVPGHLAEIADADEAVKIARKVGYPVMIKASAGGGGKGMRIAHDDAEARDGFRSARNEAKSAFGDDRVFIEKFIEQPRHIEIQVLGDKHGNVIFLGERECSIQRRHQKVIEEAPSPFLDTKTRAAMGAQAVALAKAVDYASAGTVEFIVDGKRNFYFLEMNTRLQVEHPVTECITGFDLVEWMIRIAAGERLILTQKDVKLQGWAVEARVYAEDPVRNFLPSIGRLARYMTPDAMQGVRVDTGVYEGGEISMYYDPMIAKLVGFGKDREEAIARCAAALDAYCVRGVNHNIGFLSAIMAHPRFHAGTLTTGFIAEEFPDGFRGREPDAALRTRLVALAALLERRAAEVEAGVSGQLPGHAAKVPGAFSVAFNGDAVAVTVAQDGASYALHVGDQPIIVSTDWRPGNPILNAMIAAMPVVAQVDRVGARWRIVHAGCIIEARVVRAGIAGLAALMPVKRPPDMSKFLLSPMPGLLKTIAVKAGQDIKAGEELCVVEAMKMENILRAERDGTVAKLHAAPGDSLAVDQRILEFG